MFEGLVKPVSEGYERLNPQIEQLAAQVQSVTAETAGPPRLGGEAA